MSDLLKHFPLHANGHLVTSEGITTVEVFTPSPATPEELEKWKIPADRFGPFLTGHYYRSCAKCGEFWEPRFEDDGVYIDTVCPVPPEGITTVITLNVPSGKIIVDDDLRPVYDGFAFEDENTADYNSKLGQAQTTENFAKSGCAFGPVGNTCPDLYQTGPDTYVIANAAYDGETDEERVPNGWVRLAGICTDLWAYSIADYEDWRSKGGDPCKEKNAEVVEIPAGVYQVTHHTGETGFDGYSSGDVVFAHIKKIG